MEPKSNEQNLFDEDLNGGRFLNDFVRDRLYVDSFGFMIKQVC